MRGLESLQANEFEAGTIELSAVDQSSFSSNAVGKKKRSERKKLRAQKRALKRKNRLKAATNEITRLEADFQKRRIARKIKKVKKKLNRLQGSEDAKAIKKTGRLKKKLARLKKRQARIESSGKPLGMKSASLATPQDADMVPTADESSRLKNLVEELEMISIDKDPVRQQRKVDRLLKRAGVLNEVQALKAQDIQPSFSTRTRHR